MIHPSNLPCLSISFCPLCLQVSAPSFRASKPAGLTPPATWSPQQWESPARMMISSRFRRGFGCWIAVGTPVRRGGTNLKPATGCPSPRRPSAANLGGEIPSHVNEASAPERFCAELLTRYSLEAASAGVLNHILHGNCVLLHQRIFTCIDSPLPAVSRLES